MAGVLADRAGVAVPPGLLVSFQRHAAPADGRVAQSLPSSLGALPVARAARGQLLLPVAAAEAFWIGLDATVGVPFVRFSLEVETAAGRWPQAPVSITCHAHVAGYLAADGRLRPFDARCLRLAWATHWGEGGARMRRVELRLVDHAAFARETGEPPPAPLDPGAAYCGWRLP